MLYLFHRLTKYCERVNILCTQVNKVCQLRSSLIPCGATANAVNTKCVSTAPSSTVDNHNHTLVNRNQAVCTVEGT
jgi:hypothetical protein